MSLSTQVLAFTLRHTSDSAIAARMATLLGEAMTSVTPKVAFPGDWVLAQQKQPAAVAAYAVAHCDDQEVLATVAFKAKRLSVLRALAANPHLDMASLAWVAKVGSEKRDYYIERAIDTRPEKTKASTTLTVDQILANPEHWLQEEMRLQVVNVLSGDATTTEQSLAVLQASLAIGQSWMAGDYLLAHFGWATSRYGGLSLLDVSVRSVIEALSPSDRPVILQKVLERSFDAYSSAGVAIFDAWVAAQFIEYIDPQTLQSATAKLRRQANSFTAEGVDLLLDHPEWFHVVRAHVLTDEQFARVLAMTPATERRDLVSHVNNPARARALIDAVDGTTRLGGAMISTLLTAATDRHDPVIDVLVAHAGYSALTEYISGRWELRLNVALRLLPKTEQLPGLIDRLCELAAEKATPIDGRFIMTNLAAMRPAPPADYVHQIIDLVPGVAAHALGSRYEAYVFERLSQAKNFELALDQFSNNTAVSLQQLLATVDLLA